MFLSIYPLVCDQTRLQRVPLQCPAGQTKFSLINMVLSLKAQRREGIKKKIIQRTEPFVQPGETNSCDGCHSGSS